MSRKSCLIRLFKTTVSCKLFTAIILSVFLGQPALTYAGVVIGGTRVVYLSNNADKSISVFSKEENQTRPCREANHYSGRHHNTPIL
ncbi:hypothetical protein ACUOA5_28020, partial [Escherichia coli]